jgi:hypothetical protein
MWLTDKKAFWIKEPVGQKENFSAVLESKDFTFSFLSILHTPGLDTDVFCQHFGIVIKR